MDLVSPLVQFTAPASDLRVGDLMSDCGGSCYSTIVALAPAGVCETGGLTIDVTVRCNHGPESTVPLHASATVCIIRPAVVL